MGFLIMVHLTSVTSFFLYSIVAAAGVASISSASPTPTAFPVGVVSIRRWIIGVVSIRHWTIGDVSIRQ